MHSSPKQPHGSAQSTPSWSVPNSSSPVISPQSQSSPNAGPVLPASALLLQSPLLPLQHQLIQPSADSSAAEASSSLKGGQVANPRAGAGSALQPNQARPTSLSPSPSRRLGKVPSLRASVSGTDGNNSSSETTKAMTARKQLSGRPQQQQQPVPAVQRAAAQLVNSDSDLESESELESTSGSDSDAQPVQQQAKPKQPSPDAAQRISAVRSLRNSESLSRQSSSQRSTRMTDDTEAKSLALLQQQPLTPLGGKKPELLLANEAASKAAAAADATSASGKQQPAKAKKRWGMFG